VDAPGIFRDRHLARGRELLLPPDRIKTKFFEKEIGHSPRVGDAKGRATIRKPGLNGR